MSDETFDTEALMQDVLEVLKKHKIPTQSVAMNVSLLNDDFDRVFPHLKSNPVWQFNKALLTDGVGTSIRAQRRFVFKELVDSLEQKILPLLDVDLEKLQALFPTYTLKIEAQERQFGKEWGFNYTFDMVLEGRYEAEDEAERVSVLNIIHLGVYLQQRSFSDYPTLYASVAWLSDEESYGDWAHDVIESVHDYSTEATPRIIDEIEQQIPHLLRVFQQELEKITSTD